MAGVARQFWLLVVPLLVGLSAVGLLFLAFFFPSDLYEVGSTGHILTAVVAVVCLGVVVWQTAGRGQLIGGLDEQER